MSQKTLIIIGMTIGSVGGGYLPLLFGADIFSFWGILGSAAGGFLGIYAGYKLSQ